MHPRTVRHLCRTFALFRRAPALPKRRRAFTLIELLVVIAIIAILVGLLFPAFKAVQNQARQTQAKNDLTQIVNAVNAFYTDYGKYPLVTADATYGSTTPNNALMYTLRADPTTANGNPNANNAVNTRQIVYITPPYVKSDIAGSRRSGISPTDGNYYDPWASQYRVSIDGTYDNSLTNPYGNNQGAGPSPLAIGVIAWSLGQDQTLGNGGAYTNSDDVISWQ